MTQDTIEFNSVKTSHGTEINSGPLGVCGNVVDSGWNGAEVETDVRINLADELLS